MPEKRHGRCSGHRCLRCWENKINHANPTKGRSAGEHYFIQNKDNTVKARTPRSAQTLFKQLQLLEEVYIDDETPTKLSKRLQYLQRYKKSHSYWFKTFEQTMTQETTTE